MSLHRPSPLNRRDIQCLCRSPFLLRLLLTDDSGVCRERVGHGWDGALICVVYGWVCLDIGHRGRWHQDARHGADGGDRGGHCSGRGSVGLLWLRLGNRESLCLGHHLRGTHALFERRCEVTFNKMCMLFFSFFFFARCQTPPRQAPASKENLLSCSPNVPLNSLPKPPLALVVCLLQIHFPCFHSQ